MSLQYNPFTLNNDISVMQTTTQINLYENVAAACKPQAGNDYSGQTAVVSGWGTLRSGKSTYVYNGLYCR